jgi:hypothetical protein
MVWNVSNWIVPKFEGVLLNRGAAQGQPRALTCSGTSAHSGMRDAVER